MLLVQRALRKPQPAGTLSADRGSLSPLLAVKYMREATPLTHQVLAGVRDRLGDPPPFESPRPGPAPTRGRSRCPSTETGRASRQDVLRDRAWHWPTPESRYEWAGLLSCGPRAQLREQPVCSVTLSSLLPSSLLLSFILMRNLCVKLSFRKMLNPWSQDLFVSSRVCLCQKLGQFLKR